MIPGRGFPLEISVDRCFILLGEEQNKAVIGEYHSKKHTTCRVHYPSGWRGHYFPTRTIFRFFSRAQRRPKSSKLAVATRAQFEDMILSNDLGWVAGQSSIHQSGWTHEEPEKFLRNYWQILAFGNSFFSWKSMLLSATCHHYGALRQLFHSDQWWKLVKLNWRWKKDGKKSCCQNSGHVLKGLTSNLFRS